MTIAEKVVVYARDKIGCRYSQRERNQPSVYDCSSLVYRAYKISGYDFLHNSDCKGLTSSMYLVEQNDFDLIWPKVGRMKVGRQFISMAALRKQGYQPRPGDVIYFCNDPNTTRWNKITHVALVESESAILHARGSKWGVRRDKITLYDTMFSDPMLKNGNIVAVCRLKPAFNKNADDESSAPETPSAYPYAVRCESENGGKVNLRSKASTGSAILASIPSGTKMQSTTNRAINGWYRVKLNGKEGYMYGDYVKVE